MILTISVGAKTIDGASETLGGSYSYDELRVINGGTLYVQDGSKLTVNANSIYVDSTSSINADQSGYTGGSGGAHGGGQTGRGGGGGSGSGAGFTGGNDGSTGCSAGGGGGGAGYGGYGGQGGQGGRDTDHNGGAGGNDGGPYGSNSARSVELGSGAGGGGGAGDWSGSDGTSGSRGGGALHLDASGTINIDGSVTANGGPGGDGGDDGGGCDSNGGGGGGGGASGGGILIDGNDVQISGTLSAQGGNGGSGGSGMTDNGNNGQDGGGGRIKVFYGSLDDSSANYNVNGHDSGTTYFEQTNAPPNNPNNLNPSGGNIDVNPSISADYSDPDGDSGTLYFEDGGGNNIGSCSVNDGGGCSVTYSSADSWGTSYTFQVYAEDSVGTTSGTESQSFTTSYKPTVSNLQPSGSPVQLNPQLSADVSDSDGECLTVTFRDASDNSNIGSDSVCGSGTATVSTSGVSLGSSSGTSYSFDVVVDDGQVSTTSGDQSFTTVHNPDNPTGESPSDNAVDVSRSKNLQVDVDHPDNLDMNVEFFLDGSSIGSDTVNGGSGTASINPSLGYSEDHSWSVDVDTQGYSTSSGGGSWSFQTEHNTGLNSISGPSNDPAPLNPELEASVSHSDPGEELTVEFVNDDNGNLICSQSGVTDTETVTCDPSGEAFAGSTGTNYNWRVDLSGDRPSESYSSSVQSFTTVSAPTVSLNSPNDGEENVATDSGLIANVNQDEGLELNTVITLEDDQGNFVDDYSMNSNPGQIIFNDPNLELSENYQWYADTSIVDSTYSQGDTSGTRTFSTEHDFRVDGAYPSDGAEAFGVNDSIDVEVFHSSDRSIDVEFYFNDTASGTPDVTKTVTSSGIAVNAKVDTENFDGFGEETGTNYNWSYVVSDGASDTGDITGEGLNYTTVYRPELSLNSPNDGEVNVDIDGSLDIGVLQDDNIATDVTAQLNNLSGSEADVVVRPSILGTGAGVTASFSLDDFDFVKAGETYSYNATGTIINPADQVSSPIQGATGVSTFTISPKPEVIGIQPLNGKTGTSANPLLNVTADHDESDQMTVEFYDWEKTGNEAFLGDETVASGDTASINITDSDIGDSPQEYYWYVNVTTESGTSWNNSANPYEFTVASIGEVTYEASTGNNVNLNPDNAADQGLDTIVGQETIVYQVSNDAGTDIPGIAFNVSDGSNSEVFGEVDDVESGSSVTVDLGESSLIEEDQESYEIYAFYQEAGTDFTNQDFRSDKIEFSTHVAEVEWVNPGQPGSQPINEYRIYHNNQSGEAFSNFDYVGSINDDDSGGFTVGVANLELGESNSNECFRLVSWNVAGESDPTGEQCVGVVP